ncbi:MAG: Gfo/Idh/MocA family oxidoreductase [Betaproteobacteria bacterium]|nr:Gfo/Idh/MocA family oxidoreductase [Betaproteobacteria bacterium]
MTNHPLRLGIFGVGRMGLVHLENLARLARDGEIDLVAIGDRFQPTLAEAGARLGQWGTPRAASEILQFATPEAMADQCALDACVVASRTEDHARDTLCLAGRGIRVLVEKPLAGSVAEAACSARRSATRATTSCRSHSSATTMMPHWPRCAGWPADASARCSSRITCCRTRTRRPPITRAPASRPTWRST